MSDLNDFAISTLIYKFILYKAYNKEPLLPLHKMAFNGNISKCRQLIKAGVPIHATERDGSTALHWAAKGGRRKACVYLLSIGADAKFKDRKGNSPLNWAAQGGRVHICRMLLNARAYSDEEKSSALSDAVMLGQISLCRLFLEHDARADKDPTLLSRAVLSGSSKLCSYLISMGAAADAGEPADPPEGHRDRSPQEEVSEDAMPEFGDEDEQFLRYNGCPYDWTQLESALHGVMPLHKSASLGFEHLCALLIQKGADPNRKDAEGRTPLHYAVNVRTCATLLQAGALVNEVDTMGRTPLHYATNIQSSESESRDLCNYLIFNGASIDCKDHRNATALHFAAAVGNIDACRILVKYHADIDAEDDNGDTPRDLAWKHCSFNGDHFKLSVFDELL